MIGLIMAGGGSRRTNNLEKLSVPYNRPIVLCAVDALMRSPHISDIYAAVSGSSPKVHRILERCDINLIETKGKGYSVDLSYALNNLSHPAVIVPADLPCVDADIISCIARLYDKEYWTEILITEKYAATLHLSPGITMTHDGILCRYTGVSMVDPRYRLIAPTNNIIINDMRIATNLNTPRDWMLFGATYNLAEYNGLGAGRFC